MKKILFILSLILICYSGVSDAKKNEGYTAVFSVGTEGDIPNPTNANYSTMVKISNSGKVVDKKIYKNLSIPEEPVFQSKNFFLEYGSYEGSEIITNLNKANLSFKKLEKKEATESIQYVDDNFLYTSYMSGKFSTLRKLNLTSQKDKVLKIGKTSEGNRDTIESIIGLKDDIYVVYSKFKESSSVHKFFLYRVNKDSFKIKDTMELGSIKYDDMFTNALIYYPFNIGDDVYVQKQYTPSRENPFTDLDSYKTSISAYNKKKIKKTSLKDIGVKSKIDENKFVESILAGVRYKGKIYSIIESKKVMVIDEKSKSIKNYSIPNELKNEIPEYKKYFKVKGDYIYYMNNKRKDDFTEYELVKYNFKKSKVEKRIKFDSGAKKGDILYVIDFSI